MYHRGLSQPFSSTDSLPIHRFLTFRKCEMIRMCKNPYVFSNSIVKIFAEFNKGKLRVQ